MNDNITIIRRRAVVTRALLRAAERTGLSRERLAAATGLGLNEITALQRDALRLDPLDPRWDACVLLVRAGHALEAVSAGDKASMKSWMLGFCDELGCVPADLIGTRDGLAEVVRYLEGYRARHASPLSPLSPLAAE